MGNTSTKRYSLLPWNSYLTEYPGFVVCFLLNLPTLQNRLMVVFRIPQVGQTPACFTHTHPPGFQSHRTAFSPQHTLALGFHVSACSLPSNCYVFYPSYIRLTNNYYHMYVILCNLCGSFFLITHTYLCSIWKKMEKPRQSKRRTRSHRHTGKIFVYIFF